MSQIPNYPALTSTQPDDLLPVVDVHDITMSSAGSTKKITVANLLATAATPAALTAETTRAEAAEGTNAAAIAAETTRAEATEALALQKSANLSDLANAGAARANLGLGSAATQAAGAFDAAGTAAAAAAYFLRIFAA